MTTDLPFAALSPSSSWWNPKWTVQMASTETNQGEGRVREGFSSSPKGYDGQICLLLWLWSMDDDERPTIRFTPSFLVSPLFHGSRMEMDDDERMESRRRNGVHSGDEGGSLLPLSFFSRWKTSQMKQMGVGLFEEGKGKVKVLGSKRPFYPSPPSSYKFPLGLIWYFPLGLAQLNKVILVAHSWSILFWPFLQFFDLQKITAPSNLHPMHL